MALLVLGFRLVQMGKSHLRHLFAMSQTDGQQAYFSKNNSTWWPTIKNHILLAPLWKKRHNREIRLSSAVNIGTLPSRFQTILLGLYFLSNLIYCVVLDYSQPNRYETLAELRGRSGVLSVANMIALVILAGRNNPLIGMLGISFDTYNLLHRWMGRMVVFEALVHTLAWVITEVASANWAGVTFKIGNDPFIGYGVVAVVAMTLIFITSPSIIRHAFYETFLATHILFAILVMVGVWVHCDLGQLPQLPYIQAVVGLWIGDRAARFARIVWYNYSRKSGWTQATVECLPGEACRVTLHLQAHATVKPGSHAYLRFASINPWESHPFSIAWTKDRSISPLLPSTEKTSKSVYESEKSTTDVSFVIHAQTGFTRRLYNKSLASSPRPLTLRAAFEGPYAGHHSLDSYGSLLLFAGSSGITHQIPFLRHLISSHANGTVATRRITLVWIVRDVEHLEWVRPWMDEILRLPSRRSVLTIKLFITRPKSPREICSPSSTVQMFPGRPNIKLLMETEVKDRVGAMCVTVCGPGGLADNVREAVRNVQDVGVVDLIEESFTW